MKWKKYLEQMEKRADKITEMENIGRLNKWLKLMELETGINIVEQNLSWREFRRLGGSFVEVEQKIRKAQEDQMWEE